MMTRSMPRRALRGAERGRDPDRYLCLKRHQPDLQGRARQSATLGAVDGLASGLESVCRIAIAWVISIVGTLVLLKKLSIW